MARKKQAQPGHNSAAADELRVYIERIERLESDKAEIAQDIKDVKAEAKSRGFDVKAIEKIVKERGETEKQRRRRKETEDQTDAICIEAVKRNGEALQYVIDFSMFSKIAADLGIKVRV